MPQGEITLLPSELARLIAMQWPPRAENREIRSGAIGPDPDAPGCYVIDANTAQGLRKFRQAREIGPGDSQSEEGSEGVDVMTRWFTQHPLRAAVHDVRVYHLREPSTSARNWVRVGGVQRHPQGSETQPQDSGLAPKALLSKIAAQDTSHDERRTAIIEAEVIAFSPDQMTTLKPLLREFIEQYRDSEEQRDLIAVAAAIRKFVATMNRSELSALAILLDAEHNATMPIDVELEVAKTLVRRLVQSPPDEPNTEPELADRLYEIVETYLNPRLLSRDKVAAVALNAILALCLLRSTYTADVRQSLNGLRVSWFSELVARRAVQIRNMVREKVASDLADNYTEQLAALVEELVSSET
jgi:hypothetical protein